MELSGVKFVPQTDLGRHMHYHGNTSWIPSWLYNMYKLIDVI
jgi:hypothetical protein